MVTGPSKTLGYNEPFEFDSDYKTAEEEINLQLSMQEKLARAIDNEMNSKKSFKSRTTKDVTSIVTKELAIFEFESFYENLNSIPPSNVEPDVLFEDVEELLPKLDHIYMIRAWKFVLFKMIFQGRKYLIINKKRLSI
jgi:hypothetical protein